MPSNNDVEMNEYGKQRYFDKYYDGEAQSNESSNCCIKCLKKCTKKILYQLFKLFIFAAILGGLGYGVYWGASEIIALNDFNQVEDGCKIHSFVGSVNGTACDQCNCEYLYNPWSLSRTKICSDCNDYKYNYLVTADHCGDELLKLDNDYYEDLACGNPVKVINESYNCYLYADCRGQYSFDTMYADQNQLILPIIVIVVCSILLILTCLIRCLCF
jgi:hypothetical protein